MQWLSDRYFAILHAAIAAPSTTIAALAGQPDARSHQRIQWSERHSARGAGTLSWTGDSEPATATEKQLATIWCEQLRLTQISTRDNFFELGGHSLLAIQAIDSMEASTGRRINPDRYVFESFGQIARAYDEAAPVASAPPGRLRRLFSSVIGAGKDSSRG